RGARSHAGGHDRPGGLWLAGADAGVHHRRRHPDLAPSAHRRPHVASRYTSTSALRPFTRAAVTRGSADGSGSRSRVAPLTRISPPSSLVRLWMREARLTASPTSV